ncbi:spore photoproduct lyase family protein [Nonomuraea gerenzanensis]|uniref:Spore photoproduct lyase n=1 Tax=Nonomuraea gerenzanensis TaxID=93944 RepID=A0A1M4EMT3_9ACTN|nr:spore photoproduct lyase family protein [Nonomuraea gerenzanensis]UBU11651.1 spore photoproduct lyase family protein [Nonomuraea gerenzanensis]SBP00149.1 Spore photoproduct lyase [Nonomuraea gerenzanensis]
MATTIRNPLLDIRRIYVEPAAAELPRGQEILARYPDAERVEIESHHRIPELYGDEANVARWVRIKTEALVLGVKKSLTARPNGRSADFIAPSTANGCAMACAYCYVPRRKGYSNPITVFANIDKILGYVERHAARQGTKPEPNQVDPHAWVYDIGENSDCSLDATVSDNVRDLVDLFGRLPDAKASFATKYVNRDLLDWNPRGGTRVRFSLMPPADSKLLDIRTSPIAARIEAINDFVAAGYEVHVNFSPVVVRDGWLEDWADLLGHLDSALNEESRRQLAAEVIFLTHNDRLHQVNLGWHPKAEEVLWRPDLQQAKRSETGGWNVRYRNGHKGRYVTALTDLISARLPYCRIRYAF